MANTEGGIKHTGFVYTKLGHGYLHLWSGRLAASGSRVRGGVSPQHQ